VEHNAQVRAKPLAEGEVKERGEGWGEEGFEARERRGVLMLEVVAQPQHNMEMGRRDTGAIGWGEGGGSKGGLDGGGKGEEEFGMQDSREAERLAKLGHPKLGPKADHGPAGH
jgi:hypothetical protein